MGAIKARENLKISGSDDDVDVDMSSNQPVASFIRQLQLSPGTWMVWTVILLHMQW